MSEENKELEALTAKVEALTAKLEASEGKASGILSDKKKAQAKAEELQAKIDEIEGKGLGEAERLQRDLEKMQSKLEAEIQAKTEIENNWKADKRKAQLSQVGNKFKWLDSVPEKTRNMILESEFSDIDDLGNEVLVKDRLKTVSESYAGLLAANVPSGAGSKPGDGTKSQNVSMEQVKSTPLSDIAKDPKAYVKAAMEAAQQ